MSFLQEARLQFHFIAELLALSQVVVRRSSSLWSMPSLPLAETLFIGAACTRHELLTRYPTSYSPIRACFEVYFLVEVLLGLLVHRLYFFTNGWKLRRD